MPNTWELIQGVAGGAFIVLYGLSALSRRFPHVPWLQHFRISFPQLTEKQRAIMRRRSSIYAGAQLILLGMFLPLGYFVLTVMTFNTPTTGIMTLVLAGSALCVVLGIAAMVMGGRR
jgi:hypothetical protein